MALVVVFVCAAVGTLLATFFAGATVTVHPRTETVIAPKTLVAQLNAPVGTLSYQSFSVSSGATTTVPATGQKQVSRQASGVITVYNSYSTASQRLIANTRFEASDGKIYRIRDSVTVPGTKGTQPGSVSATVYADSPGEGYNRSAASTFTIPGFKGDPRYSKFTAQSVGPISGGFVGTEPAVASADLAAATQSLQQQLDAAVRSAAVTNLPQGYTAIPGTLVVTFSDLLQTVAGEGKAALSQTATARGAIVRTAELASVLAQRGVQNYGGEAVGFGDASKFDMKLSSTSKPSDERLTLDLTGETTLVWQFDPNALTQALVGKAKSSFETTLQSFAPAIHCTEASPCDASIRPFWQSSFPSDPAKIKIVVK